MQPLILFRIFLLLLVSLEATDTYAQVDSLLKILETNADSSDKAAASLELSKLYMTSQLEKTFSYAQLALRYRPNDSNVKIEAYSQLAKYNFFRSELDSSLHYFNLSLILAKRINGNDLSASINTSIGAVLLRQAKYEDAISTFIDCARYFESQQDEVNAAKCYNNMASAHAELRDYHKAIDWSLKALEIFQDKQMIEFVLITLPNLATQYAKSGDTTSAIKYFIEAEKLGIQQNSKRSLAITFNNLGDLYLSKGQLQKAQKYIEQSISLKEELNLLKGIGYAYHNLGHLMILKGQHQKAIDLFEKALLSSDLFGKEEIYRKLKKAHQVLGNLDLALHFADLAAQLSDSIAISTNTKNFAEISEKYQSAQQENRILLLENNNHQLTINRNRTITLLIGSVGLFIALFLIGLLHLKNLQRQHVIAKQNHELVQREMIENLKQREEETMERILQSQEEERARIAADLHDSLGSKLAALKLQVEEIANDQTDANYDAAKQARDLADHTYKEVRNLSHNLKTGVKIGYGLLPALREMTSYINRTKALRLELIDLDAKVRLENKVEIQLFRAIQELVTNTLKHASASQLIIQVAQHDETLSIIVEDDGNGFDISNTKLGLGLKNIENRMASIGAIYHLDTNPGNGTTAVINITI